MKTKRVKAYVDVYGLDFLRRGKVNHPNYYENRNLLGSLEAYEIFIEFPVEEEKVTITREQLRSAHQAAWPMYNFRAPAEFNHFAKTLGFKGED